MNPRNLESMLLTQCTAVARELVFTAGNQCEANVYRLAGMVIQSRFPREARNLMMASQDYFTTHPDEKLAPEEVVRRGWILSLPRLRDMLSHRLYG